MAEITGDQTEMDVSEQTEDGGSTADDVKSLNSIIVDNEQTINITVKTQQDKKVVGVAANAGTNELKEATAREFGVTSDRLCFIYSGKVLPEIDLLSSSGIKNGTTVHLVIKSSSNQVDQQLDAATGETSTDKASFGPMHFAHVGMDPLNYAQLQQHMQRQILSNPEMIRDMVQNPLVQQLMSNPSVITDLISSNPQTKDWLKRNPDLVEMLNDKEIMQQTLEISNNPEMLDQLIASQGAGKTQFPGNTTTSAKYGGATSLPDLQKIWQHLAKKPQVLQQMFSAPYTKSFLEGLSANPQITQQMISNQQLFASNPVLQQQMLNMMPQYLQQLQNPSMQSMMTSSKAMQAMIKVQHGLEMLHAEVPGLIGSLGLPHLSQPPSLAAFAPSAPSASTSGEGDSADPMSSALSQMISQIASGNINQPPEQRFKDQLDQLLTMGFTDQQANLHALVGTFGDLSAAVEHLNRLKA